MKLKINLDWTSNLYEAGGPIRSDVREIAWRIEQNDKRLEEAKKLHAECLADIQLTVKGIEREIAKLWTPEEIEAAKRGVMLANGMECQP